MDAGIATEENLTWLRQQHYNWICVSREGKPQPPEGVAELTLTTSAGQQVQAWKLASKDDEARLYAVSAARRSPRTPFLRKTVSNSRLPCNTSTTAFPSQGPEKL